MTNLDNPAGRLHYWLSRFSEVASDQKTVVAAWSEVLGVESITEVMHQLTEVASLIPQLERVVILIGDEAQRRLFEHHFGSWYTPILAPRRDWAANKTAAGLIDEGSLHALDSLSSYLSALASEGSVPNQDMLGQLRGPLQEALEGLTDPAQTSDLDDEVRRALHAHMHDLLGALDNIRIGGPQGVKTALRLLRCKMYETEDEKKNHPVVDKALRAAARVWIVFTVGTPATEKAIDSFSNLWSMLPPGSAG